MITFTGSGLAHIQSMTSYFKGCSASSLTISFSMRDRIKHLRDKMLGR
ncbi:hypothetical protein LC608_12635 [Nostoc sp. XA010]|nr:hypothetical protein [Nostoc sp. XA010]MCC5657823.1 hypothetical protein [Nostoc sp. XA010]